MGIDVNLRETPASHAGDDAAFTDGGDGAVVSGGGGGLEQRGFFLGAKARRTREERMKAIRASRESMARFSSVDVHALSEQMVDDMIPLPDMAEEVKDRPAFTTTQPTTLADRILAWGEIAFIVLAAGLAVAFLAKFAGV